VERLGATGIAERVLARAAVDRIGVAAAVELVPPAAARERVAPVPAGQVVVLTVPDQPVGARSAGQRAPHDHVGRPERVGAERERRPPH
jgi:hypothetical protein